MGRSILVTGGARSGKSAIAERLTLELGGDPVYIATAEAGDAEMAARIALHRDRRGSNWTTREVPLHLAEALHATDGAGPRLVDCLTLWLSNLMLAGGNWQQASQSLAAAIPSQSAPVVFVTNEVGAGIVPENALARTYRDAAGLLNQSVAAVSQEVYLAVAGIPVKVK